MNTLTTVLAVILLLFVLRGAWRGLTGELAPLVGLIACGGILWFGYAPLHTALAQALPNLEEKACVFYSALAITVVGFVVFFILACLVKRVGAWVVPQPFNAVLGGLIGGAKAVLMISVAAGLVALVQDRLDGFCGQSEQNPVSAAAIRFWNNQFDRLGGFHSISEEVSLQLVDEEVSDGRP